MSLPSKSDNGLPLKVCVEPQCDDPATSSRPLVPGVSEAVCDQHTDPPKENPQ